MSSNATAVAVLTSILGAGGAGGLVTLLRAKADKELTVTASMERAMLALERMNDRLGRQKEEAEARAERAEARLRELGASIPGEH